MSGRYGQVLFSLLAQFKDYPLDSGEPLKEFKKSNGRVKSLLRKVTVVRRGGGWDGTVTASSREPGAAWDGSNSLGLAERNAWGQSQF